MPRLIALTAVLLALASPPADALELLTHGKVATFRADSVTLRFERNRALATLIDPTCASGNASTLQLAGYVSASSRLVAGPVIALPCASWRAGRGGFVYEDSAGTQGGVRKITYRTDRLVVKLKGPGVSPVTGPVAYVEMWLGLGTERLLARFHNFRRNDATVIATPVTSSDAARGEEAFWDVIWGVDTSDARQGVAIHCLLLAIANSPRDGRSWFLLGMIRLYRFGLSTPDYRAASEFGRREIRDADTALARAATLLWKKGRGDSRVPGFAAAAKYAHGIVENDATLVAEGLADLEAAVAINPVFNLFDYIGVVPPTITPTDPLYPRVLEILDLALSPPNAGCVVTQPEICGNAGMAPHNIEGAFVLFGDLYAKGGVLDDPSPLRGARNLYTGAVAFGAAFGWAPSFQTLAAERLAAADDRVARYLTPDAADDPLIVGTGPGEACATCHRK